MTVSSTPLAVDVRLSVEQSVANDKGFDYASVLARVNADGTVSADELSQIALGLSAEVAAGTISQSIAKGIMARIAGRVDDGASAAQRAVVAKAVGHLGDLSLTADQLEKAKAGAKQRDDRVGLAKDLRGEAKDGSIDGADFAKLWQDALGSDGKVSRGDVSTLYRALDNLLAGGTITAAQHTAMQMNLDAALTARSNARVMTTNASDYIHETTIAHALSGPPDQASTWAQAIDMMTFELPKAADGKRLSGGDVHAIADMVLRSQKPVTDATGAALASALNQAVAKGEITQADAKRVAHVVDMSVGFQRFGIGRKDDFSIVGVHLDDPGHAQPLDSSGDDAGLRPAS